VGYRVAVRLLRRNPRRAALAGAAALAVAVAVAVPLTVAHRGGGGAGSAGRPTVPATAGSLAAATPTATQSATPSASATAPASPSATPTARVTPRPATPTPPPPGCPAASGTPPAGTLAVNFPTALAFAPDGRLFWSERRGTIRVLQGGVARAFATVATVTTEPGGGYSERGLLGLALSPSFAADHYVYAFYDLTDRVHQDIVRFTDCGGVGTAMKTTSDF